MLSSEKHLRSNALVFYSMADFKGAQYTPLHKDTLVLGGTVNARCNEIAFFEFCLYPVVPLKRSPLPVPRASLYQVSLLLKGSRAFLLCCQAAY